MHNKNCRSRKISRNVSAPTNMTKIQKWISQLVKVGNTHSHFSVKACGLFLHLWKFVCPLLPALGAAALGKWGLLGRARVNFLEIVPISYNFWKRFEGLSLDLVPNEHII